MSMIDKKLTIPIEIENLDELNEAIEKASRLVELLQQAQKIISSLCIGK